MGQLVDLKVGFSCNNKCSHCVVSDKYSESDLSLNDIKELIYYYINKYSSIDLTLTGGEITFREDYLDILDFLRDRKSERSIGFVDLQTNGRMLCQDKILNATISVVDYYLIALHSHVPAVHDCITSVDGSFEETTQALLKLSSCVDIQKIAIQAVINKKNYIHLKETYKYVHDSLGIRELNITFPHPIGIAFDRNVTPTYFEIQESVNEALRFCLGSGIKPYLEALPACIFDQGLREYALMKQNEIIKKEVVGFGGKDDGHIDYCIVTEEGYSKYESCSRCEFNNNCIGVWKEYKKLYPNQDMYSLLK